MKAGVLFFCVVIFSAFQTVKIEKNLDFTFVSGTYQTTYGGAAGSGSSTLFRIKLKANRTFKMVCDSAYAMGKIDALYILSDSFNRTGSLIIKKGKVIDMELVIRESTQLGGGDYQISIPGSLERKKPKNQKGTLILRYKGGKNKYMNINSLKQLDPIFAP